MHPEEKAAHKTIAQQEKLEEDENISFLFLFPHKQAITFAVAVSWMNNSFIEHMMMLPHRHENT